MAAGESMNGLVRVSSLQWAKDRIIESGAERWARPVWMKLARKQPSSSDAQVAKVMAHMLRPDSICIDVGAHKGLILDIAMRYAPRGTFYAFEPLPYLGRVLSRKYRRNSNVNVYQLALADVVGTTSFYINRTAMGFSSLGAPSEKDRSTAGIETCTVTLARLDDLLPEVQPDLIKIDVEGAELGVLRGGLKMIQRTRPVIVFEHGLGGADRFGTTPEDLYHLLTSLDLRISLMARYLASEPALSMGEFSDQFYRGLNNNFIAYPHTNAARATPSPRSAKH
jgi:FkbM family methyltransferase